MYHQRPLKPFNILRMQELIDKGKQARNAAPILQKAISSQKDQVLRIAADELLSHKADIIRENEKDIENARKNGLKDAIIDRLTLTEDRIEGIAEGLFKIIQLEDPIGEVISMNRRPNGLTIGKKRVPIGVIGMIYEARPNVTVDVFGLCIKTGNAVILRGGKEAFHSNNKLVSILRNALNKGGLPADTIQLIQDTSRESAVALMKLNEYLDLLIPRGGAGLIQTVVQNSTVPVIETGVGNCHVYVDVWADPGKAVDIVYNSKTHRVGVCNAAESLIIHSEVLAQLLPSICEKLRTKNVEIRGDERVCKFIDYAVKASEEDWGTEYLDYIISVKTVDKLEEAIAHINTYGTKHSESIVTENYTHAQKFLEEVDAAAVYVNASTRFTDGFEYGFGAEIGISTQKMHARGPMGLKELTTTKYIVYGDGQIRG